VWCDAVVEQVSSLLTCSMWSIFKSIILFFEFVLNKSACDYFSSTKYLFVAVIDDAKTFVSVQSVPSLSLHLLFFLLPCTLLNFTSMTIVATSTKTTNYPTHCPHTASCAFTESKQTNWFNWVNRFSFTFIFIIHHLIIILLASRRHHHRNKTKKRSNG